MKKLVELLQYVEAIEKGIAHEYPEADMVFQPVALLTPSGIITGKVVSEWHYARKLKKTIKFDDYGMAHGLYSQTTPPPKSTKPEPVQLDEQLMSESQPTEIHLVDVDVRAPGTGGGTKIPLLTVDLKAVQAWVFGSFGEK